MSKPRITGLAPAIALVCLMAPGRTPAQNLSGEDIFFGAGAGAGRFSLGGWGSGKIEVDHNQYYTGNESLRVNTQGYYQGAVIGLKYPVNLASYLSNPDAYLEFTVQLPDFTHRNGTGFGYPGGGYGGRGGFPGGPGGGFPGGPGGGFPGGPGGGYPGAPTGGYPGGGFGRPGVGGRQGSQSLTQQAPPLKNLRVQLVTTQGKVSEMLLPFKYAVQHNNWQVLSIPVTALKGISSSDATIQQIRVYGDGPGTVLVGKISVAIDSSPLSENTEDEKVVALNAVHSYTIQATAGSRPLEFSWDWDASDGIQQESVGRSVLHAYYKKGDYKVTVTAEDPYTKRILGHITFNVHVHA